MESNRAFGLPLRYGGYPQRSHRATSQRVVPRPRLRGIDPITRGRIYRRQTAKTLPQAQIVLGKLLEQAEAGKQPESGATVAQLLDQSVLIAEWDLSTREGYEGYIRRTIKPALGHLQVRKVHGPMLDMLYARLKKCGDLARNGRPFTEHRNVPDLRPDPAARPTQYQRLTAAPRPTCPASP